MVESLPSPMRKGDMKPLKIDMGDLKGYLSNSRQKKRGDRSGAQTQEGFYKESSLQQDSIIASEYDNVNQYAKMHRQSVQAHVEPFNLPGGVYNKGRRILFQGTGKILMPHDRILESFSSQRVSNKSIVGNDSILISARSTKVIKDSRHSRAASQMHILTG